MRKLLTIIGRAGLLLFAAVVGAIVGFLAVPLFISFVFNSTAYLNDAFIGAGVGAGLMVILTWLFPKPMEYLLEIASFFT